MDRERPGRGERSRLASHEAATHHPPMAEPTFDDAKAAHSAGDLERAAELYARAAAAHPEDVRSCHNLGVVLEAQGRPSEAEAAYARALEPPPGPAWTHYNLARLRHLTERLEPAEAGYRRAIELDSGLFEAHFNLGRLLLECGEPGKAEAALRDSLRLAPDSAEGRSYLGDALFAQKRAREALEAYRATAGLLPHAPEAQFDVAKTLEVLSRLDEAAECYRRCIALDPRAAAPREGLARALDSAGHRDAAIASVREWLSAVPDDAVARHVLASMGGAEVPERASDDYVRATFDRFAADFDATLTRLGYRAPQLLAEALASHLGEPRGELDVLDLGCGTGLCGPLLRPWARRLEGVDLSSGMLERARHRECYDALHEAELVAFLRECKPSWDVMACADTLCYFGDLSPVLAAAAGALRPGGVLAFTLERMEDADKGWKLDPAGRYAHSKAFVQGALERTGFEATVVEATLRSEGGDRVGGLVVTAQPPAPRERDAIRPTDRSRAGSPGRRRRGD